MTRQRDAVWFLFFLFLICLPAPTRVVYAQRPAETHLTPAGLARIVNGRQVVFGPGDTIQSDADMRATAVQRAVTSARMQRSERQHLWPWFALGGAVIGGAAVAILGVTQCDAGCQDDGALSRLPAYAAVGAIAGGGAGAIVGLLVDTSISRNDSQTNKLPDDQHRHSSSVITSPP